MEDYIKKDKDKKLKSRLEKTVIFLLILLVLILSYILYQKTQVTESNLSKENVTIERTIKAVDEVKNDNKTVTDMIEEINNSVVGISKVKTTGSSIFSNENITNLGTRNRCDSRKKWIYFNKCSCKWRKV